MQSTSDCSSNGFERINQFALVSYIPDPLGSFLDELRIHLVPDCKPHAHVTVLPPRPLCGEPDQAIREIGELSRNLESFTVQLGDVCRFPVTNVVYIELASGVSELLKMYQTLNTGVASFCEKFAYSPHITIAQCLPEERVDAVFEEAKAAWRSYRQERSFQVDVLSFVQNTLGCRWIDLEDFRLREPARAKTTQKVPAAQLRPA